MNHLSRRNFLKKTGLSSLGLWAGIGSLPGCKNKNFSSIKKNWVWITPSTEWSTDEWKKLFEKLLQHNITGTHVQIYSSHMALYETPWLPVIKPILEKIIPLAAAAGIELHAWMWSMPNNNPFYVENHPEFYVVNRLGQPAHSHPAYVDYYRFMCPNQPGVQEFMHRNVSSLISTEGLQGVHFDYIRMPDVIIAEALQPVYEIVQKSELPAYDYCYCPVCRSKFKEQTGADPLIDLSDPAADAAWRQFRYDSVTHLVNDILLPVVHNSGLKATAAVFPNWESVRQQWNQWNMDAFFPMLYHNFYNENIAWIGEHLIRQIASLKNNVPVYSGLYLPALNPKELQESINISFDSGASGYCLFSYDLLSDDHFAVLI